MIEIISIVLIIVLLYFSAFWSGSETALTVLSKYRIKKIIALNKPLSNALKLWLRSPYYLLTTILVGNTVTNLALSFTSTVFALYVFRSFHREAVEFSTWMLVTLLLVVLGEVTPKIYARCNPEKVVFFALPFITRILKIALPVIWPVKKLVKLLFPRAELVPVGKFTYLSKEEIKGVIHEANNQGMLGKETSQMLERVLKLADLEISHIMTPYEKIESVNINQDKEVFLDKVIEIGRSRVPVYSNQTDKVIGFIHTKDLLMQWQENKKYFSADIIRPAYFVNSDKKVYELLKEFQSGKTHVAFVKDTFSNLVGLVTLEDILEEIVGEILDEYELQEKMEKK